VWQMAYDRCTVICRAELRRAGSQQHRFQFKECAQQFIRMHNVAATFAMRVNDPTPAIPC